MVTRQLRTVHRADTNAEPEPREEAPVLHDTTLVVVGYNCPAADIAYLEQLVEGFAEGIFVDNGPKAHSLSGKGWRTVATETNVGFGAAANQGAKLASTPLLLFLNPDARLDGSTAAGLRAALGRDPSLAAIGPNLAGTKALRGPNAGGARKTLAHAVVFAVAPARCLQHRQIWRSLFPETEEPVLVDWVSAACLLVRREAFLTAGGFPLDYFLYDEDVALGLALTRAGHRLGIAGGLHASHRQLEA